MTNKLQVTSEQFHALGKYIENNGSSLTRFVEGRQSWRNRYAPIKDLTIDEMATALYVGYEIAVVVPEFKVGDWVTQMNAGAVLSMGRDVIVSQVVSIGGYIELNDVPGVFTADYLRLATPNEIFWAELGRGTNELRYGDAILIGKNVIYRITEEAKGFDEVTMEDAGHRLGSGSITKIFPVESMLEMPLKE